MNKPKIQKGYTVSLNWQETVQGKLIERSFKLEESSASKHMTMMKNNPLVKNAKIVRMKDY